MFTRLPNYARKNCQGGRLPIPVNFVLDEFCNVGYLGDFKKTISVCRSFNLNCQLATQGIAQLSDRYPNKEWEEIIGNCDTQLFLGCNDQRPPGDDTHHQQYHAVTASLFSHL